jgi:hypothetical protein
MQRFQPETLRLGRLANGNPAKLAQLKELVRAQERMGVFTILSMDDDTAVIAYTNSRFAEIMGAEPLEDSHVH